MPRPVRIGATGPLPHDLPDQLEALKLRLVEMRPSELGAEEAERLRVEISAIRLQLKRLAAEREDVAAMIEETLAPERRAASDDA